MKVLEISSRLQKRPQLPFGTNFVRLPDCHERRNAGELFLLFVRAKTVHPSFGARDNLDDETITNDTSSWNCISTENQERLEQANPQSASNFGPPWNAAEMPEIAGTSRYRILATQPTRSLFQHKSLHLFEDGNDALNTSPVEASLKQRENFVCKSFCNPFI